MMTMKTILVTGGAGYVGAMLAHRFAQRPDVGRVVCVDREPMPDILRQMPGAADPAVAAAKISYIQANLADDDWVSAARAAAPSVVIHTAWQIREMYGQRDEQWRWNIGGAIRVFDFAFGEPSVERLVHFSTVSSYAARPDNTIEHRFTEEESFRDSDYLYATEKRRAEDELKARYEAARAAGGRLPQVSVVRPAAITGPRGRFGRIRFGLQAALSGQLRQTLSHRIVSALTAFVPVTERWCRQFVHEDDVADIVERLAFGEPVPGYEIFNLCPPGPVVLGADMARVVGKRAVRVHPLIIRAAFFLCWHLSRGRIPTSRGGWKAYAFPVVVDGSKVTRVLGHRYAQESCEAFSERRGRYADLV